MVKKPPINVLLFISIISIILISVPHHAVTEKQAINLACKYYTYRMNDDDLQIEDIKVSKAYKDKSNGYIHLTLDQPMKHSRDIWNTFLDFWNPNLVYYRIIIRTNESNSVSFAICVDSYSGFVQDGSEGIMWKRAPKESCIESVNEVVE